MWLGPPRPSLRQDPGETRRHTVAAGLGATVQTLWDRPLSFLSHSAQILGEDAWLFWDYVAYALSNPDSRAMPEYNPRTHAPSEQVKTLARQPWALSFLKTHDCHPCRGTVEGYR